MSRGAITNGLAYYLKEELFANFKKERVSHLESKWQRNLDAFNSVSAGSWKPKSVEMMDNEKRQWRSDTFIAITKMKVMAAWSLVVDMLLQGGEIPFMLIPSPWDTVALDDLPEEERQQIEDAINDMTEVIHQQLLDCNADRQLMKCIMSNAIYGETYAKWYINKVTRTGFEKKSFAPEGLNDAGGEYSRFEAYKKEINSPSWEYTSVWDIFRDLETEDLQAGAGIVQRQMISPYNLRNKIGKPYYIKDAILKAIKDADSSNSVSSNLDGLPPSLRDISHRQNTIELLEFWCRVPTDIIEDYEKDGSSVNSRVEYENDGKEIEIMAVMADNEVVRYSRVESGKRPFYRSVWEVKLDHIEAVSVADNIETVQTVLNGMVQTFEDNKKLSANVILALKRSLLEPGAFDDGVYPGMEIDVADECDDARMAVQQIIIQDVGQTLLDGIALFERYGDEITYIPKISQGFVQGQEQPNTAYELSQRLLSAGKYIGGVIKNQDEGLIEPIVNDILTYNMADPDLKKGKGNFLAKSLGFTSFQDRIVRTKNMLQFISLLLMNEQLATEGKFAGLLEEIAKSLDLEKSQVLKSADEKREEAERAQNSPEMQMQMQAFQIDLQGKAAQVEKTSAEVKEIMMKTNKMQAEIREMFEELKLERAKVVNDLRNIR